VARIKATSGSPDTDALLARAQKEVNTAHAELRELARGLHPIALAERGLPAAIEPLCVASPVPVALDVCSDALSDSLAVAAYFVVAESLTNGTRIHAVIPLPAPD
jgi:signal transduction histidine kinase